MNNNNGQKLAGKIAVVTGGSSGIGLATDESSYITGVDLAVDRGMAQV